MIIARWPPSHPSDIAPHTAANYTTNIFTCMTLRGFVESQLNALFRESTITHSRNMLVDKFTQTHTRRIDLALFDSIGTLSGRTHHS